MSQAFNTKQKLVWKMFVILITRDITCLNWQGLQKLQIQFGLFILHNNYGISIPLSSVYGAFSSTVYAD